MNLAKLPQFRYLMAEYVYTENSTNFRNLIQMKQVDFFSLLGRETFWSLGINGQLHFVFQFTPH